MRQISNKEQLKDALRSQADEILVTNDQLYKALKIAD